MLSKTETFYAIEYEIGLKETVSTEGQILDPKFRIERERLPVQDIESAKTMFDEWILEIDKKFEGLAIGIYGEPRLVRVSTFEDKTEYLA